MEWMWLCIAIGLFVLEFATTQLVSIWFAASAMLTAILTAIFKNLGFSAPWQLTVFAVVAVALLFATRPLVKKILKKRGEKQKTNLELYIGKEAIVVEDIDNIKGLGAVKIGGIVWSARTENGQAISKDEIVIFKEINGNKAIVEKKGEQL